MAKNYSISFMSLRAGTLYTLTIGGGTGTAVQLNGGARPFTTQEDDNEDMFTSIRTQTGYFRIVDNGKDANGNAFDWKDLIPSTDTSRPVTLTSVHRGQTITHWRGFMQAQDFGSVLYGNPQEREFPVQCVLSVTQGTDINYQQTAIQNFAYLLKQIVSSIPASQRPTSFYIQGGVDAQAWLLTKIDWTNFVSEDGDGGLMARYNCYDCLDDMCKFWGWTARTKGDVLYLTCADDSAESTWLYLTSNDLATMAGGTAAGTTGTTFATCNLDAAGDIFASTSNNEYVQRGFNRAQVDADTNRGDDAVFEIFDDETVEAMKEAGWQQTEEHGVYYTNDVLGINRNFMTLTCRDGYGSLNIGRIGNGDDTKYINVMRIRKTGGNAVTPFIQMETVYEHNFNGGFLMMFGKTYRYANEYTNTWANFFLGENFMFVRIGIGHTRATAKWWDGYDMQWKDSVIHTRIGIGNEANYIDGRKDEFPFWFPKTSSWWATNILTTDGLYGKLFIDFLGTDDPDLPAIDGEKSFELSDLKVTFQRRAGCTLTLFPSDIYSVEEKSRPTRFAYKSSNTNSVRADWNADCIYATENACKFGYGQIFGENGALIDAVPYSLGGDDERPEQHLANRVTHYWQKSRRRLSAEVVSSVIDDITPRYKVTLDGTLCYPIAISREWVDDVTMLTMLEMNA